MVEEKIGLHYYLFSSDEGEVMSGAGEGITEEYLDFILKETKQHVLALWEENLNRTIILTIDSKEHKDELEPLEILKNMGKEKLQELLKIMAIITDPLSQELMKKAAEGGVKDG